MEPAARQRFEWQLRSRTLRLGERTLVMGILNLTPDSFSDGGAYPSTEAAVDAAAAMLDSGVEILDIGGESTRPGSAAGTPQAIAEADEQRRVLPVVERILRAHPDAVVSVDTYHSGTARRAIEAGAEIVNDVSGGLWDPAMLPALSVLRCGVVAMHTRGLPVEWEHQPRLGAGDVVPLVVAGLRERIGALKAAGVELARVVLDPGFGFGKRGAENWALLAGYARLAELELPTLTGLSRKGFLRSALGAEEPPALPALDSATAIACAAAALAGAHIVRVHNVAATRRTLRVADAVLHA